jgi:transcriptional regulator with XRE-family HTH domain
VRDAGPELTRARLIAGLTRAQLAERASLSVDAIYSYEAGRRVPAPLTLRRLRQALETPDAPSIPPDRLSIATTLGAQVYEHRWPSVAVNERDEMLYWSRASDTLYRSDLAALYPTLPERNMLALTVGTQTWFGEASRLALAAAVNEDAVLRLSAPSLQPRYFQCVVDRLVQRHSDLLSDAISLSVAGWRPPRGARQVYHLDWAVPDAEPLAFNAVVRCASLYDAIWVHDLHPADAAAAEWLQGRLQANPYPYPQRQLPAWHDLLRWGRQGSDLTRAEVASAAGVSAEALYSYERGRRRPGDRRLAAIAEAIELDAASNNLIRDQLGYEPAPSRFMAALRSGEAPSPDVRIEHIRAALRAYPWPCFVMDAEGHFRLRNRPGRALGTWGERDGGRGYRATHDLFSLLLDESFQSRTENYLEVAHALLAANLWRPVVQGLRHPSAYTMRVLREAASRDRTLLPRLREDWLKRGRPLRQMRITFPLVWRAGDDVLTFDCVVTQWSVHHDWWVLDAHPADGTTWRWLAGQ